MSHYDVGDGPVVPVADRKPNQWLEVTCSKCGTKIMFPWAGYDMVSCETCNSTESTEGAWEAPVPSAGLQIRAAVLLRKQQEIEKQMELSVHHKHAEMAKQTMTRFVWMLGVADFLERCVFGVPVRYGKLKVYLKGWIILPPSSGFVLFPLFLMFTPYLTLLHAVPDPPSPMIYSAAHAFMALGVMCLFKAQWTEPGVIPKQPAQPPKDDIYETVNGKEVPRKWCTSCHLHRPVRASHCATCDVCVDGLDHHCHITGTCVGKRNLLAFYSFLIFTLLADITVGGTAIYTLYLGAGAKMPSLALVALWCFLGFLLLFLMWLGLTMVMTMGMTGREHKKRIFTPGSNPFDLRSPTRNVVYFLCTSWPSLIWRNEAVLNGEGDAATLV
eukprot:TRINITY_DN9763_c0_g1_i1.p1 TRINITY_DN9763_c0_g1~~TRINITY_DN9763_c0_g1_i1.p1  ORF type:complete len:399 (+),score=118.25 TRINITY_DN9763_c0_g1_i1:44-1198(+)